MWKVKQVEAKRSETMSGEKWENKKKNNNQCFNRHRFPHITHYTSNQTPTKNRQLHKAGKKKEKKKERVPRKKNKKRES